MAETVGVSRSPVRREAIEGSTRVLKALMERRFENEELFVIDGSKALRSAIDEVYGAENPVQRCRNHKLRNVIGHLPKEDHDSEMFPINRLGLPAQLRRCLGTTNLIDSTHSGARQKTRRVTNWQSGGMALRWAAAAFVGTERRCRRILGYRRFWVLKAHLDDHGPLAQMRRAS